MTPFKIEQKIYIILGIIKFMKKISRIYEALLNRKEKVCRKEEIAEIIKEYKEKFRSGMDITDAIKYLSRHKYIKRIFQSYYYINNVDERKRDYCLYEDKELLFIVLNKLKIKWYVGLTSSLYIHGKFWQVPRVLHLLNNRFAGTKNILSLKVKFSKIKESLFFGLNKFKTKNGIEYYYSDKAKTSLDMVYLKKSNRLIKYKLTKRYFKEYPRWIGEK